MKTWTFEELHDENEKNALGLQYTIAQRDRLRLLLRIIGATAKGLITVSAEGATGVGGESEADLPDIITALLESPAERHQDIFALLINGGKRNGYFVEFGACDGLAANNTVMLERRFGWKGILAEPDRFWQERLPLNRTAIIDKRCVSSETGRYLDFYQSDRPGNSSPDSSHAYLGGVVASYQVETVSLLDLLKEHRAPRFIDFLSVDTEGHEKAALANFDFDQYRFGFICVEEHEGVAAADSVEPILQNAGYTVIFPREEGRPIPMQITGVDKFFVPSNHPTTGW
ncbi:MAG: FkbM family methyltransferase [Alphaproteobacteria bacterium]